MPTIKLVAIDIDGTLADHSRQISQANQLAVANLIKQGIIVVLASGRIGWSVRTFQDRVGLTGYPLVGTNGCEVIGWDQQIISHSWIDLEAKQEALDLAEKHQFQVNGYAPNDLYFSQSGRFADLYRSRVEGADPDVVGYDGIAARDILKLLFIAEPDQLDSICREELVSHPIENCTTTRSEPEYLEFLPTGISKGTGLQILCHHLGILQSEVAAIGDYYNDREMLEWVGLSAAMGNAPDDLKSVVHQVVADHNSSGVAEFLNGLNLAGQSA